MNANFRNMPIFFLTIFFAFVNIFGQTKTPILNYPLYKKALLNESTAPNYILVSVKNENSQFEIICIVAPFLLGAIHKEFDIAYSVNGERKALDFALKNKEMKFSFQNDSAAQNIKPRYTTTILKKVFNYFSEMSTYDLLNRPSSYKSYLLNILKTDKIDYASYRDATAFLLLKRNILPTRGCVSGNLYVTDDNVPIQFINYDKFIGNKFSTLLKVIGDREYDYQFINEPPLKLVGCQLSFETDQRMLVYFQDITSQPKFNIEGDWDFEKLNEEVISSIKMISRDN